MGYVSVPVNVMGFFMTIYGAMDFVQESYHLFSPDSLFCKYLEYARVALSGACAGGVVRG